ncbi:MAG: glycosyltransferase family 2 protein [Actinomycetes bacterium]
MSAGPEISVVVPVRDGAGSIGRCLDALALQVNASFEVIVVDNGSTDETASLARQHPLRPRVVTEPQPGSYAARNAGVRAATAPVLAFTDVDCSPQPRWLSAGLATLQASGADLVGGAITMSRTDRPTLWEHYDRAVYLRQEDVVAHGGWAVTANLLVRRQVFDAVGAFDASLLSGGDREFCLRAGRAGFRIVFGPHAVVTHEPRRTRGEIWLLNKRIGGALATLHRRGEIGPWWRSREHWMNLDWVIHLIREDGPPLRRRHVLPVHAWAMTARLYGRWLEWLRLRLRRSG